MGLTFSWGPRKIQTTHTNSIAGFSLWNARSTGSFQEAHALRSSKAPMLPSVCRLPEWTAKLRHGENIFGGLLVSYNLVMFCGTLICAIAGIWWNPSFLPFRAYIKILCPHIWFWFWLESFCFSLGKSSVCLVREIYLLLKKVAYVCLLESFVSLFFLVCPKFCYIVRLVGKFCLSVCLKSCISLFCCKVLFRLSSVFISFVASVDPRQKWVRYFCCFFVPPTKVCFMTGAQNLCLKSLFTGWIKWSVAVFLV